MKHVKHGKKLISLLLSAAVAMSMTLSTVMTPLAASSSVSDLRQRLQELQTEQEKVNQQLKDAVKDKLISEDDERRAEDDIQKLTDKYVAEIDKLLAQKEQELMQI